jgi:hypothetical protein
MSKLFAFILIAFAASVPAAQPRVHSIGPAQTLEWPLGGDHPNFLAEAVGIDDDSIIVLVDKSQDDDPATRTALLYRRGADQRWAFSRILTQVTAPRSELRAELTMRNNLAVIKIRSDVATVWEKIGGNWVQATVANGLHEPGHFAISGSRILAGSSGCENDGLIYEKSSSGSWVIIGRIAPDAGVCADQPRAVELNYDFAYIRSSPTLVRSYRQSGSALQWPAKSPITLSGQAASVPGAVAVQLRSAVTPGLVYYTRDTDWNYVGQIKPIDYAMGPGDGGPVIYRDGLVLTFDGWDIPNYSHAPYVYAPNSTGGFDHVAVLGGAGDVSLDFDISGKTVVVASATDFGFVEGEVAVYVLPSTFTASPAIANNFDARNVSGLTPTPGSGFTLLGNSSNYYFRQTVGSRDAAAVYNDTDWSFYQGIEADVTPSSWDLSTSYSGVAVRYVDDNNFYFAGIKNNGSFEIGRKLNGATTILAQRALNVAPLAKHQISLSISGSKLYAYVSGDNALTAQDASLTHGSAALVTHRARANFDNTYVKPTAALEVFSQEYPLYVFGRELTYIGGHWDQPEAGLQQSDTSGKAFAIVPNPPISDQTISAVARLDSFGSTNPVSWFGLVCRYTDAQNYYYLSIRSSNSLQIRKVVNGVGTALKTVTFTVAPGDDHSYEFEVRGNELSAAVDGVVLARAIDNSLTRGQVAFATYRASARYTLVSAEQP